MKRRTNGEGSIYQTARGWRAVAPGGSPSFRRKTRREAADALAAYLRTHRQVLEAPRRSRETFGAFLVDTWLPAVTRTVAPRTLESYETTVRAYVIPVIGDIPLALLTPAHVAEAMSACKRSPRTVNYVRSVCRIALGYAVKHELIARNVAALTDPVRATKTPPQMPGPDAWGAFLEACAADSRGAIVLVMALGGLRVSEACAISREEVEFSGAGDAETMTLRVTSQIQRRDGLPERVPLKTQKSLRVVRFPAVVAQAVRAQIARAGEWRIAHPERDRQWDDLVFLTRLGTPYDARSALTVVHRVFAAAGIDRKGAHYLRHVAASHLLAADVPIGDVSALLGHTSIRTTKDVYGHMLDTQLDRAAEAMDRITRRGGGPSDRQSPRSTRRNRSRQP